MSKQEDVGLFYEGNLSNPELLERRVKAAIDAGAKPTVFYVYAPPKAALERQVTRAKEIGRYVTVDYGSKVHANTPGSIEKLYEKYGDRVRFWAIDNSGAEPKPPKRGIDAIRQLAENKTSDEVRDEQLEHAKSLHEAGTLPDDLYQRITGGQEGSGTGGGDGREHQAASAGSLEAPAFELETRPEEKPAAEASKAATPALALADAVYDKLKAGESLGNVTEFNKLAEKAFGASRTSGAWTPKDGFDAMETGINQYLLERGRALMEMPVDKALAELRELMGRVTSQGTRTEDQLKNQQFSTPPTESYVVARVAGITPSDVVAEPSAGNGGLAVWPKAIGATVAVNEISPRRVENLKHLGFDKDFPITEHDGEIINSLLPPEVRPTVIVMNPPFSASTQKQYEAKNRNQYGFNHVSSALQRLEPNGRLVAILGGGRSGFVDEGASFTASGAKDWFRNLAQRYNIRANVRVSGKEYQKYGTSFATRILVIDKDGPTPGAAEWQKAGKVPETVINKSVETLEEAYNILSGVAESRPDAGPRTGSEIATREREPAGSLGTDSDAGIPSVHHGNRISGQAHGKVPAFTEGRDEHLPGARSSRPGDGSEQLPVSGREPQGKVEQPPQGETAGRTGSGAAHDDKLKVGDRGLDLEQAEAQARRETEEEKGSSYVSYQPTLKGADHPGAIVETKAMATVPMPPITYKPNLPESVVGKAPDYKGAKISAVQLEAVAVAGMQNEIVLPNGARASALIGDGTGVGKGRESAAILWDNWRKGRRRLVWMTKSKDLIQDAIRDLEGIGATDLAKSIKSLGKLNVTQAKYPHSSRPASCSSVTR